MSLIKPLRVRRSQNPGRGYIISICYSYVQLFGPDLFKLYYHYIRLHPRYLEADRTFVVMELLVSYSQKASGAWKGCCSSELKTI